MKYKIGDKIRILNKQQFINNPRVNVFEFNNGKFAVEHMSSTINFIPNMSIFSGKLVTISDTIRSIGYKILEDEDCWTWAEWMICDMDLKKSEEILKDWK